jgi:hypothetical protein
MSRTHGVTAGVWVSWVLVVLLVGCSGHNTTANTTPRIGQARVAVSWMERAITLPRLVESVLIEAQGPNHFSQRQRLERPKDRTNSQLMLQGLPVGEISITLTAYPQLAAQGTPLATGSIVVQITADTVPTVELALQSTIDHLALTSSTLQVAPGAVVPLHVSGRSRAEEVVLLEYDRLEWTSSAPTIATVDGTGLVQALKEGTVTISVRDQQTGQAATIRLTVQAGVAVAQRSWTVMVYLGADNNLEGAGIADLNEMEEIGSTDQVAIVAQFDRIPGMDDSNGDWTDTRRFYVQRDEDPLTITSPSQGIGEADMGTPDTLRKFITWAKATYPAQQYCLVIWNHGGGFREPGLATRNISYDSSTGSSLSIPQVRQALEAAGQVDIVAMDACTMAMLEIAVELTGVCDYFIGAESNIPYDGFEYQHALAPMVAHPSLTARQIVTQFVTTYAQRYAAESNTSLVAVEQRLIGAVTTACDALARALLADPDGDGTARAVADGDRTLLRDLMARAQLLSDADPDYRDAMHFAQLVAENVPDPAVRAACAELQTAIHSATCAEWHHPSLSQANGLSIWLPDAQTLRAYTNDYNGLRFAQYTAWLTLLMRLHLAAP